MAKIGYARVSSKEQNLDRQLQALESVSKVFSDKVKGATLEVLNLPSMSGIEDDNLRRLINNLVIELYKYQAESDRKRIKERQAQGIALAKEKGKFKGRKLKFTENDPRLQLAFKLYIEGATEKDVERQTGINRRTFQRYRNKFNIHRK